MVIFLSYSGIIHNTSDHRRTLNSFYQTHELAPTRSDGDSAPSANDKVTTIAAHNRVRSLTAFIHLIIILIL